MRGWEWVLVSPRPPPGQQEARGLAGAGWGVGVCGGVGRPVRALAPEGTWALAAFLRLLEEGCSLCMTAWERLAEPKRGGLPSGSACSTSQVPRGAGGLTLAVLFYPPRASCQSSLVLRAHYGAWPGAWHLPALCWGRSRWRGDVTHSGALLLAGRPPCPPLLLHSLPHPTHIPHPTLCRWSSTLAPLTS